MRRLLTPASPVESGRLLDRPGPTYTVDTLRDLRREYGPDRTLYFITGADALNQILTWRDHDEVLRLS